MNRAWTLAERGRGSSHPKVSATPVGSKLLCRGLHRATGPT